MNEASRAVSRLQQRLEARQFAITAEITPPVSCDAEDLLRKTRPLVDRLERAADPAAEGERICAELIEAFAKIPRVAGVHVMAPANEAAVPRVIAEARRRVPVQAN